MFRRPIKEINAEFPAEDRYLDSIRRVVKESCTSVGMPRKDVSAVLLAIEEGATNVIRHAYLYEKGILRLRIVLYDKFAAFSLIDTGRSFEPNSTGSIDLERLVESGRKGGAWILHDPEDHGFGRVHLFPRFQRTSHGQADQAERGYRAAAASAHVHASSEILILDVPDCGYHCWFGLLFRKQPDQRRGVCPP